MHLLENISIHRKSIKIFRKSYIFQSPHEELWYSKVKEFIYSLRKVCQIYKLQIITSKTMNVHCVIG